jgi:predicted LPLAT superfamily acyltransferase
MSSVPHPSAIPSPRSRLHWAALPEAGMSAGLWFLYGCHRLFGRGLYRALMWPVSWYFICVRSVARRASIDYLSRIGEITVGAGRFAAWSAAARHVRSFADALLDKALVWTGGLDVGEETSKCCARSAKTRRSCGCTSSCTPGMRSASTACWSG